MLVDTGLGLPDARERWAAELAQLDGAGHDDPRHALPPRPRRCRRRSRRAHRRTRLPGRARPRSVPARLGERRLVGAARRLVPPPRRPRRRDGRADRPGQLSTDRSSAPMTKPSTRRRRRRLARLESRRRARPRRRPAAPAPRRRARRRRSSARPDHADRRALAREPPGSARRLPRCARADDRARADGSRYRGHGEPIDGSGRPRSRADRASRRTARRAEAALGPEPLSRLRGLVPALRRRPEAGCPSLRRRRDAVAPRAARSRRSGRAARGQPGTWASPILPPSSGRTSLQYRAPRRPGRDGLPRASRASPSSSC